MHHDQAVHQKSVEQIELPLEDRGEALRAERSGEATSAVQGPERSGLDSLPLMERVVEGGNLRRALKRVQQNKGSPGVDGLTVEELPAYLTRTLARDSGAAAHGTLPAERSETGGDSEIGRRRADARHSDRARSVHSAGRLTGPATDDRSHLLRVQLWLSAGPSSA